jgi:hypothetical protein
MPYGWCYLCPLNGTKPSAFGYFCPYACTTAFYWTVSFGAVMLLQLCPHLSYDNQQNVKDAIIAHDERE